METTNQGRFLTVDEICEYLRIGRTSAYRLLQTGQIEGVHIGRKWLVSENAVKAYLARQVSKN